jgi:hypothetical protein
MRRDPYAPDGEEEITGPADPANPAANTGLAADEGGAYTGPENSSTTGGPTEPEGYRMEPGSKGTMAGGNPDAHDTTGFTTGKGRFGTG